MGYSQVLDKTVRIYETNEVLRWPNYQDFWNKWWYGASVYSHCRIKGKKLFNLTGHNNISLFGDFYSILYGAKVDGDAPAFGINGHMASVWSNVIICI